jgi:cation:H+ antiporter
LPFEFKQAAEIWLTAGQSFFAIAILVNFRISVREALALLALFVSQVGLEFALIRLYPEALAETYSIYLLLTYTAVYIALGVGLLISRRRALRHLTRVTVANVRGTPVPEPPEPDRAD